MTLAWWLVLILASGLISTLVMLSFERRKAAEEDPARQRYYAGLRAMISGDSESAFQRFKESVLEDSQNVDAYLRIGDLLRDRGQAQKALSIHQDLASRGGLSQEELLSIRRAITEDQLALGQTDDAVRGLTELAEEREGQAWALARLHRLCLEQGDYEEAYKLRQKLARLGDVFDPRIAALYLTLAGVAASDAGQHRRGRVLIRDALKQHTESPAAHYYLGILYERDRRPEDAVRAWKALLDHTPRLAGLVFPPLEKVLFDMGQYSEIAGIYQQVLAADSVNTDALLGLARFSDKKGDHQAALGHLARTIEIDPGNLVARQLLVQIHRQEGHEDEAWQAALGFFTWLPSNTGAFRCRNCRHESVEPRWFCPQCRRFDSFDMGSRKSAAAVSPVDATA